MAVNVSTTDYESAHGKRPRGWGSWAFFIGDETEPLWHTGKYSDAKRMAVAYALTKRHDTVRVGS